MPIAFKQQYNRYRGYLAAALALYNQRPDLKKFLELFLSLGAISVFSFFAIKPTIITIVNLVKELKAKEEVLKTMDTKIENLNTAQNIYFQQESNLELLNLVLPDTPSPETFARQVEVVSRLNSVSPTGIALSEVALKGEGKLSETKETEEELPAKTLGVNVSFSGNGGYEAIENFILNFNKLRRLFKIDSITINKEELNKEEAEGKGLFLALTGKLLYFNQGKNE